MNAKSFGEVRAVLALAAILSFRMLGLFMIYPVFALYAPQYHHATSTLIGIALGAYGLTQALLQLPFSMLSDRVGRKPIIIAGLLAFLIGSLIAGFTDNIYVLIAGRCLQGAGAIGSTLMAFAADLTRVEHRTKAMAVLGMTIGLSFGIAMLLGPIINSWLQLKGIFWLTALSAAIGMLILYVWVPEPKKLVSYHPDISSVKTLKKLLFNKELFPLNLSILLLHAILTANFVVIPLFFKELGVPSLHQWHVYLPVLIGSFITVIPLVAIAEKKKVCKSILLLGIFGMTFAEFFLSKSHISYFALIILLYVFFTGFTLLEALLPSLISKIAPANRKGSAMGIYSSLQFLGIFLGGWLAGLTKNYFGNDMVTFSCCMVSAFWLIFMLFMKKPPALKTKLISLKPNLNSQKAQHLVTQLLKIPGVLDAEVSIEDCIAYLKVDNKMFDQHALENSGFI